jgi:hypothetical protein
MPAEDLEIKEPGAQSAVAVDADDAPMDPKDARIAELETTVAQLSGALDQANAKLAAFATVPSRVENAAEPERVIGDGIEWRSKTSAEARAAGVKTTVLCSDGYFVP